MIKLKPLLFEVKATRRDMQNTEFMKGVQLGMSDKQHGNKRHADFFKELPDDFVRGYKFALQVNDGGNTDWWAKANDKLTDLAAMFGRSYGNRR